MPFVPRRARRVFRFVPRISRLTTDGSEQNVAPIIAPPLEPTAAPLLRCGSALQFGRASCQRASRSGGCGAALVRWTVETKRGKGNRRLSAVLPWLILSVALISFFHLDSREASAACRCACVNGEVVALCSNSLDIPPICPPRLCPIVPPAIEPIQPPRVPPLGTTQCRMRQVLNPWTGGHEWKEICQ